MANGWQVIKLGEVLTERRETPSQESIETGEVSIVSKIGFNAGKIELRNETKTKTGMILIRPGDLVISGINAVKGAIAIYSETAQKPVAATIHYGAYIPNKERVDIKFLWWFLRSAAFRDIVQHHIPGGIKTELKAKRFLAVPVPLPPLTEQRRIVARIEALAARVAEAQSLRRQASEAASSLFFSGLEVVYQDLLVKQPSFPLIELVKPNRGISYGVVLLGEHQENGIPTLRAGDLKQYHVNTTNLKMISPEISGKYERTKLRGGEILLKIRGGYGDVAVCPSGLINANVSREIAVIPLLKNVIPEFGMYVLSTTSSQERMSAKLRGTSYQGLNLSDVRKLPIPVPPLEEQRRLVAYLDGLQGQVSALRVVQAETERELFALMPSILDKAFKGEL